MSSILFRLNTRRHKTAGFIFLIFLGSAFGMPLANADPSYVGSQACKDCHQAEFEAWQGSHHDLAMAHATPDTVLGDFDNAEVTIHGITSKFFRRYDKYIVLTDGPDGEMAEFEITHTFGIDPLQQYLVTFPDGRLQALSLAWDSRNAEAGGQRWFHLYPDQEIAADDELHWTGRQQNWNYMCADCHSTSLVKGFDADSNQFNTTWSEINVACEACHGPGQGHVEWSGKETDLQNEDLDRGLSLLLRDRKDSAWIMNPETGVSARSRPLENPTEVEICAVCHSRRGTFAGEGQADASFLNHHMPAFLTQPLYYPDGQIRDEVYVWGSFTQSKMFEAGVTCSDCHEPHSLKLRAEGDAVCAQCHLPTRFAVTDHHGHPDSPDSPGCLDCHMPETTYMVVDPRRDHRMGIPDPSLSEQIGAPNTCNGCHAGKSTEWAVGAYSEMFPDAKDPWQSWGVAFNQAYEGLPQAELSLLRIAADEEKPDLARATAVIELGNFLSPLSGELLQAALKDQAPLVRLAALRTLERLPPEHRFSFANHLLTDELLAIRAEAGRVLAATPPDQLLAEEGAALSPALDDYIATQKYNADRPESWLNLGNLRMRMGDFEQAEADYQQALKRFPDFVGGYLNLADLYRSLGRESEAEKLLGKGLEISPDDAALHHALGLALVRGEEIARGLAELRKATELDPSQVRYAYVYAVGLNSTGDAGTAITVLEQAHTAHPTDMQIMQSLVFFERDRGNTERAVYWLDQILAVNPADQGASQLRQSLSNSSN